MLFRSLVLAVLALWGLSSVRQRQVAQQLEGLQAIPAQVQALEAEAQNLRRQIIALKRSNEGLAKGIVAVSSGSALLAQLAAITPEGIQLTDVRDQSRTLRLTGIAADPQAFRRVNGLNLLLAGSPLFEPQGTRVLKLSRDSKGTGTPPISWELSASFAELPALQQLAVLQQLGAEGLVRRLQVLQRAEVLP